jgi:hypothetical protein
VEPGFRRVRKAGATAAINAAGAWLQTEIRVGARTGSGLGVPGTRIRLLRAGRKEEEHSSKRQRPFRHKRELHGAAEGGNGVSKGPNRNAAVRTCGMEFRVCPMDGERPKWLS